MTIHPTYELLCSPRCSERRHGVDQLFQWIDTAVSRYSEAPALYQEGIQHAVTVLTTFAHADNGCFGDGFHSCECSPVATAVEGITARISNTIFFTQPAIPRSRTRPNAMFGQCPVFVSFAFADLPRITMRNAHVADIDFSRSTLTGATFTDTRGKRTDFSYSHCPDATFHGDFSRSHWMGVTASNAMFRGDFYRAHFDNANLDSCAFVRSDLLFACLRGATAHGTDFRGCRAQADLFRDCHVDDYTMFPDGSSIAVDGRADVERRWPGFTTANPSVHPRPILYLRRWGGIGKDGEDIFTVTPWYTS